MLLVLIHDLWKPQTQWHDSACSKNHTHPPTNSLSQSPHITLLPLCCVERITWPGGEQSSRLWMYCSVTQPPHNVKIAIVTTHFLLTRWIKIHRTYRHGNFLAYACRLRSWQLLFMQPPLPTHSQRERERVRTHTPFRIFSYHNSRNRKEPFPAALCICS